VRLRPISAAPSTTSPATVIPRPLTDPPYQLATKPSDTFAKALDVLIRPGKSARWKLPPILAWSNSATVRRGHQGREGFSATLGSGAHRAIHPQVLGAQRRFALAAAYGHTLDPQTATDPGVAQIQRGGLVLLKHRNVQARSLQPVQLYNL
jgi:hypothetical protein